MYNSEDEFDDEDNNSPGDALHKHDLTPSVASQYGGFPPHYNNDTGSTMLPGGLTQSPPVLDAPSNPPFGFGSGIMQPMTVSFLNPKGSAPQATMVQVDYTKPRILLMGLPGCGKTSIERVVMFSTSPADTRHIETTRDIEVLDVPQVLTPLVCFQMWDFPGQPEYIQTVDPLVFGPGCSAIIFVVDAQNPDQYEKALEMLSYIITTTHPLNNRVNFEVFIHKVDSISDDNKLDHQRNFMERIQEFLAANSIHDVQPSVYLTSVYDHSVYEAFSKVIQKLVPSYASLGLLVDSFTLNSGIDKTFLFDIKTKIFIATDAAPVEITTYELLTSLIEVTTASLVGYEAKGIPQSLLSSSPDNAAEETAAQPPQQTSPNLITPNTQTIATLSNNTTIFFRALTEHLAIACIFKGSGINQGLIELNLKCFKQGVSEILACMTTNDPNQQPPSTTTATTATGNNLF
ncbi:GTPase-interacting protein 2 [Pelomyxa schiedti]|nr:GTPase-interacting protein 2 [Pelomyxa schiedti]